MRHVTLLFPPNWSACVSGPHLALPLMSGIALRLGWTAEIRDLSQEFGSVYTQIPSASQMAETSNLGDFEALDDLYFSWEDQFRSLAATCSSGWRFGLLSAFSFDAHSQMPLARVLEQIRSGTVYTPFYREVVLPRLLRDTPAVIGVTIASQAQVVPAVELLTLIREAMPQCFIVLGGNIVTRLRGTPAFDVFASLADRVVVFQGEAVFADILRQVDALGVDVMKAQGRHALGDEMIPWEDWPVPDFGGLDLSGYIGVSTISYVSTRGCYWGKCHFCAIPAGWSTRGYGGSAPGDFVARQLSEMVGHTGVPRVKFVDEAFPPAKLRELSRELARSQTEIEWEAYARLEPAWENQALLGKAYEAGLRKLYFGLEQAPGTPRALLGKNDRGDPLRILSACATVGVKVHLFCMVGHPGSSKEDAWTTTKFLIDHQNQIDTADLVAFRHDRGTQVPGVRPLPASSCDWAVALPYVATAPGVLSQEEVAEMEDLCQEAVWESAPRLLHPLYRVVGPWDSARPLPMGRNCQGGTVPWSRSF